jgi:hypothetical protein
MAPRGRISISRAVAETLARAGCVRDRALSPGRTVQSRGMRTIALLVLLLGCGGGDDTMATPDGGPHSGDAGPMVITAPPNTWTWIPFPNTTCGNGTPAGFGINVPATPSTDMLVYFEGGGACWDGTTCFQTKTAVNIDVTYDATSFAHDIGTTPPDRSAANPFGAATLVWIPYCTGDLHAGITTQDYPVGDGTTKQVHHTGATNTQAFVDSLKATFPTLTHLWLSGSSAGGYGATFNQHRFAAAWPDIDAHVLQDSSPFVPVLANYDAWRTAWTLQYPPSCTGCETDFPKVIDAITAAHPTARIGLLTYNDDATIKAYFGYTGSLVDATNMLVATQYAHATTKAFVQAGTSHTMLGNAGAITGQGGIPLPTWIAQWATGDAAWATNMPP